VKAQCPLRRAAPPCPALGSSAGPSPVRAPCTGGNRFDGGSGFFLTYRGSPTPLRTYMEFPPLKGALMKGQLMKVRVLLFSPRCRGVKGSSSAGPGANDGAFPFEPQRMETVPPVPSTPSTIFSVPQEPVHPSPPAWSWTPSDLAYFFSPLRSRSCRVIMPPCLKLRFGLGVKSFLAKCESPFLPRQQETRMLLSPDQEGGTPWSFFSARNKETLWVAFSSAFNECTILPRGDAKKRFLVDGAR